MKTALKPALEHLDKALGRLEKTVELKAQALSQAGSKPAAPKLADGELDLSVRNERDLNRKIASRLDQTISRLEVLLSQ